MNKITTALLSILLVSTVKAEIKLPDLVGSNMVLQRGKELKLWGYGKAGEKVTLSFAGKTHHSVTAENGKWTINAPALKAGGPYSMQIQGENKIILNNILIGDVWICSGQSNMEFNLQDALRAEQEIKTAAHPQIRLYNVDKTIALKPQENSKGSWQNCTAESARYFPAIGYFFGRRITTDTGIPIGLINASWGGTVIETWISTAGLEGDPDLHRKALEVSGFNIPAYNQQQGALNAKWVSNFNQQDAGLNNGAYLWAKTNHSNWANITLPTGWEFSGKPELWEMDGIVWFSKEIELTDEQLSADAQLSLGVIQNADQAFFNGEMIGQTPDIWGKVRNYVIPKHLLRKGTNTITVRVENYGGDGGFMSKKELFFLKITNRKITLEGEWKYKTGYKHSVYDRPEKEISPNTLPTVLYNSMISPLTGFSIKGVLWYQGESNWDRGEQYRELFPAMIADWRKKFNDQDIPFLYVQLANYHRKNSQPADSYWAELREAQDLTQKIKKTGMVTAVDVGDSANIHPKNKQEVGRRLALLAEKQVYHLPVDSLSAAFNSFKIKNNTVVLTFKNAYNGLKSKSAEPGNFQIAGADHQWHWAKARITSKNTIEVYNPQLKKPVAVRYAWEDNPADANVINSKGLPLFPFRTDNWKGITSGRR